jgi:hypothetical protein
MEKFPNFPNILGNSFGNFSMRVKGVVAWEFMETFPVSRKNNKGYKMNLLVINGEEHPLLDFTATNNANVGGGNIIEVDITIPYTGKKIQSAILMPFGAILITQITYSLNTVRVEGLSQEISLEKLVEKAHKIPKSRLLKYYIKGE